jgi:predicted nuclease with RNAse H fold
MFEFKGKCTIGIDLAGLSKYPTGWALLKDNAVETRFAYTNNEISENIARNDPSLIAIDAPLSLPKRRVSKKSRQRNNKEGIQSISPNLLTMKKLTLRAKRLNILIEENAYKTI